MVASWLIVGALGSTLPFGRVLSFDVGRAQMSRAGCRQLTGFGLVVIDRANVIELKEHLSLVAVVFRSATCIVRPDGAILHCQVT